MKQCPKCQTPHERPGTFCSRTCANGHQRSDESRAKASTSAKSWWGSLSEHQLKEQKAKISTSGADPVAISKRLATRLKTKESRLINSPWNLLPRNLKREQILRDQHFACLQCRLTVWLDKPITIEIDHINGNRLDNTRENLRGLCPNCHSFTDTWKGKTRNNSPVSDTELRQHIITAGTIHGGLLNAGMAPRGNNYKRARRVLTST